MYRRYEERDRPGPAGLPLADRKHLRNRVQTAKTVGLRYVSDVMPGISRERTGKEFRYRFATGDVVTDEQVLKRIKSLAIPPAWSKVWICPDPYGHLQATGRDARGRKQHRYHPRWREVRDENKYSRLVAFGKALPKIRRTVERDLRDSRLSRRKVLATVVRLLELSLIRIGNPEYAKQNSSFGLTTMRDKHVSFKGAALRFTFKGKSGKWHSIDVQDKRVARIVKGCQDLPGQELFQYEDAEGVRKAIRSQDVNEYLSDITGAEFTAKDFRTWAGTVMTAQLLRNLRACETQKQLKSHLQDAVDRVAERLGNTPAVCRKCYIHPHVTNAYLRTKGAISELLRATRSTAAKGLRPDEAAVLSFLKKQRFLERENERDPARQFAQTLERLTRQRLRSGRNNRDKLSHKPRRQSTKT